MKSKEFQPDIEFRSLQEQGREVFPADSPFSIFSGSPDLLTFDESNMLEILLDGNEDRILPPGAVSPSALAAAMGQKHRGNLGSVFESLCRKGFADYWRHNNMFHVKRAGKK